MSESAPSVSSAVGSIASRPVRAPVSFQWKLFVAASVAGIVILLGGVLWALSIGPIPISLPTILGSIFHYDGSLDEIVVRTLRLPRVMLALLVGAGLAVAGVVMQSITENPLGAPEILGVNAGAASVMVTVLALNLGILSIGRIPLAFGGGAVAALIVLVLAGFGQGRTNPVRLALAGVTVTSLLLSVTQGIIILHENSTQNVMFWLVGGVNSAQWSDVQTFAPWLAVGLLGAMALAGSLNVLALGEDMARALGVRVQRTRLLGGIVVIVLAGAAIAVAGPIAFIGLIVPHISRKFSGLNHYLLIPLAALFGSILLVYADIGSRFIDWPFETPAGILTAAIGAPFFVYLARRPKLSR